MSQAQFLSQLFVIALDDPILCILVFLHLAAAQTPKAGLTPCALLTRAEVRAAAGAPVSEGVINATN
jgi:hypothetical protein